MKATLEIGLETTKALNEFKTFVNSVGSQLNAVGDKIKTAFTTSGQAGGKAFTGEVSNSVKPLRDKFKETGEAAGKQFETGVRSGLSGLMQFAKQGFGMAVGFGGFNLLINGIKSLTGTMIQGNAALEQYKASFDTMLGSAEQGTAMMEKLRTFAAKTPFEFPDLAQAAQTMLGFGINTQKVMPYIQMLGDVSMGNKEKFQALTLAFSQVQAAGKLTGQDLLQMINAGFNPLKVISEQTGKSIGDLKKEMEKGGITSEMVAEAFRLATSEGGQFFGMMEKQSQTLTGLISTLKDNLNALIRGIGKPLFDMVKTVVDGLLKIINDPKIQSSLSNLVTVLSNALTPIVPIIANIVSTALPLLVAVIDQITPFVSNLSGVFVNLLNTLAPIFTQLIAIIIPVITKIANAILPIVNILGNLLGSVLTALLPILSPILDLLAPIIELLAQILLPVLQLLTPILTLVINLLTPIIQLVGLLFQGLLILIKSAITPLTVVVSGLAKIFTVIQTVISNFINTALSILTNWLKTLWNWIKGISDGIKNFLKPALDLMNNTFKWVENTVKSLVKWITDLWNSFKNFISTSQEVSESVGKTDVAIQEMNNSIQETNDGLGNLDGNKDIFNTVSKGAETGKTKVKSFADAINDLAKALQTHKNVQTALNQALEIKGKEQEKAFYKKQAEELIKQNIEISKFESKTLSAALSSANLSKELRETSDAFSSIKGAVAGLNLLKPITDLQIDKTNQEIQFFGTEFVKTSDIMKRSGMDIQGVGKDISATIEGLGNVAGKWTGALSDYVAISNELFTAGSKAFKEHTLAYKLLAVAQATMSSYLAGAKVLAEVPFPASLAAMAVVIATGLTNVLKIMGVQFKSGGYTGDGGVNDVAGIVHKGEFVVNADATKKNLELLNYINAGGRISAGLDVRFGRAKLKGSDIYLSAKREKEKVLLRY